jgi:coproporphyrinogen III oxidase
MIDRIRADFAALQDRLCARVEAYEPSARFRRDAFDRQGALLGFSKACVLEGGAVFERAGVNFTDIRGKALPRAASERHPEITGEPFAALGVSLVFHPKNPFAPTVHMNVRLLQAETRWWFGGGFDLTPIYPFAEDAKHFHSQARDACAPSGEHVYPALKAAADQYFFLKHRNETRGVGGLFVDDLSDKSTPVGGSFAECADLIGRIANHFDPAYFPILDRRKDTPYDDRERDFQSYRRGRYVEFNLALDRGTAFGLQAGGRTESILMSLPPIASWRYDFTPEPGTREAEVAAFLQPRDWL